MQGWYAPILSNSTGMSETVNPATGMYYLAPTTWTESLAHVAGNTGVDSSIRVGKSE